VSYDLPPEYKQVSERIRDLKAAHPNARLRPVNPEHPYEVVTIGERTFIVYSAACYRDESDLLPGIGVAWEPFPGTTPYTRGSELMNAETSAWGRAIVAALQSESKAIASAEDVRNRRAEEQAAPPAAMPEPWWRRAGYPSEEEGAQAIDGLNATLRQVPAERRAPVRAWLSGHGYPPTVPVLARAEHVEELEALLAQALMPAEGAQ
jgi:hypothetical protein